MVGNFRFLLKRLIFVLNPVILNFHLWWKELGIAPYLLKNENLFDWSFNTLKAKRSSWNSVIVIFFFGDMFEYLSENTCVFTIQVVINRLISDWFYWRLHQPQRVGLPVSKVSWDPWDHGWNLYLAFWGHLNRLIRVIMWCVW